TAGAAHRSEERLCFLNTLRGHADHALRAAAPLRSGISHPGRDEALRLQPIQGDVERSYRAPAFGCALYLATDGRAVSVIAQPRGRAEQQVLELAEHDYYYIVSQIPV